MNDLALLNRLHSTVTKTIETFPIPLKANLNQRN